MTMNRKQRRRMARSGAPLSRAEFELELTRVIEGDRGANRHVAAFWDEMTVAGRIAASTVVPGGVSIVRKEDSDDD